MQINTCSNLVDLKNETKGIDRTCYKTFFLNHVRFEILKLKGVAPTSIWNSYYKKEFISLQEKY